MSDSYFGSIAPIEFEGPESDNPLAYRYYDKNRVVLGKSMADQLRPAVCYWHTFAWEGSDGVFGQPSFERPWHKPGDPMQRAQCERDHRNDSRGDDQPGTAPPGWGVVVLGCFQIPALVCSHLCHVSHS